MTIGENLIIQKGMKVNLSADIENRNIEIEIHFLFLLLQSTFNDYISN